MESLHPLTSFKGKASRRASKGEQVWSVFKSTNSYRLLMAAVTTLRVNWECFSWGSSLFASSRSWWYRITDTYQRLYSLKSVQWISMGYELCNLRTQWRFRQGFNFGRGLGWQGVRLNDKPFLNLKMIYRLSFVCSKFKDDFDDQCDDQLSPFMEFRGELMTDFADSLPRERKVSQKIFR